MIYSPHAQTRSEPLVGDLDGGTHAGTIGTVSRSFAEELEVSRRITRRRRGLRLASCYKTVTSTVLLMTSKYSGLPIRLWVIAPQMMSATHSAGSSRPTLWCRRNDVVTSF